MACAFRVPQPPLAALVERLWDWEAPPQAHRYDRILPSAQAQLIVNLAEDETRVYDEALRVRRFTASALDAPAHRSFVIDTAEQVCAIGAVFRAGGAAPFFRERMDVVANDHVDLDALAGDAAARDLRTRLLEAGSAQARLDVFEHWLLRRMRPGHGHPAVAQALRLLDARPEVQRVASLAAHCRLSERRLGELFRHQVGMSPKRYVRLRRFNAVVARVHGRGDVDWAAVAADGGFHDQPHLVHEFRAFSGMTPGAYVARRGQWAEHVPLP